MAHPHKKEAHEGHSKKLASYGGKSKKTDHWSGEEDLNTAGKPAGLMPLMKEPKLSSETNPEIMRKAGGKVAPKRLDKAPRKAKGGALKKHDDEAEDKALIRKMVKSEDLKEVRTKRKDGGRLNKDMGGVAGRPTTINIQMPQQPPAAGAMPPRPMMPPSPPPGMPAPGGMPPGQPGMAPPMPPMPPTGAPAQPPVLGRKKGGRIRSTDDLTAGAGSGEGRLQKTELQENA